MKHMMYTFDTNYCKGCNMNPICIIIFNNQHRFCPCVNCLVKVTCSVHLKCPKRIDIVSRIDVLQEPPVLRGVKVTK